MAEVKLLKQGTSVRHCVLTAERSPMCRVCGHWIKHWKNYTPVSINRCCLCDGEKEVGAHITICEAPNDKEWIIPTCKSCNTSGGIGKTQCDVWAVRAVQCD